MKKIIIVSIWLLTVKALFGQEPTISQPLTKQDYLQKSKNQRTAATILLIGGVTVTTVAALTSIDDLFDWSRNDKKHPGMFLMLGTLGSAATVGGIVLFIAAARNKGKATSVSFKPEKTFLLQNYSITARYIPSVSLKLRL